MKQKTYHFLNCLIVALMVVFVSCNDRDDSVGPQIPDTPGGSKEWEKVDFPTAIIGQLPSDDFGKALGERFISGASLSGASVAVFTGESLQNASIAELKAFYNSGKMLVVVNPLPTTDEILKEHLGATYSPYCDQKDVLIYAFNNQDRHFLIFDNQDIEKAETDIEETDVSSLIGKYDENESEDADAALVDEDEEIHQHDHDYYHSRLQPFIDWLNKNVEKHSRYFSSISSTRSGDGYNASYNIDTNSVEVSALFPISLHHQIDKATGSSADYLNKDSDVQFTYNIYPLYVHKISGRTESAAGDYYIVEGTMTVHNGKLWDPYKKSHGGCNNRVIGYYMTKAISLVELLDKDDTKDLQNSMLWKLVAISDAEPPVSENHLSNLKFYREPVPQTYVGSTTYTDGVTYGMNLSIGGKYSQAEGFGGEVNGGFSAEWSNTISQTLPDVTTQRHTDGSARVKYVYNIENIHSDRNWGDWDKKYPLLSRSDFSVKQSWIWKIPAGQHGVDENKATSFLMKISFKGYFGTYNWWRGASWSNSKTFSSMLGIAALEIAPPSRQPFGVLAIKNAADETIANISIKNTSNNDKYSIPSSYSHNEVARIKLPAAKYEVSYDVVNPPTHEKVSSWKMDSVEIKMGENEDASTTTVSTVNFKEKK